MQRYMIVKRLFDIVFSFVFIVICLPFTIVIAIAVLVFDGSPVFFVQKRVGRNRKLFNLYKFRTMRVFRGSEMGTFDAGKSHRVTPLGQFLRKSKLDEIPQLMNVFIGDMSLVGPRPEVEKWVNAYPSLWDKALSVKPGVTDLASIMFRNEEQILSASADPEASYRDVILPQKLSLYNQYVDKMNLPLDVGIIIKTVWRVIT
jgi:lipopolysaccharide/colanic/teichoic acid biosynthesis glycosyltransferase